MVLGLNHWFRPKNEGSKKSVPQNCKSAGSDALKKIQKRTKISQDKDKRKQSAEIRGALEDALIKQSMKWVGVFVYYINNQFRFLVLFPK